jgi:sugar lactone lactonase YvrE
MAAAKWTRALTAASAVALMVAATAPAAVAAPDCPGGPVKSRTLLSDQGTLESVIVDWRGRLFFTNDDSLLRLDRPQGKPRVLVHISDPGGLAFDGAGNVIVGYGNTASNGAVGDLTGPSGLLRVNPDSGRSTVYATGLSMANGLVRGPDGSYYASNDFGSNIDRIRNGHTERGWARVDSGNGLAIDTSGRYLYVAQTFRPAAIQRVELAHPGNVTEYVRAGTEDMAAGLDGMARDAADRLFVAANGAGQIWRVGRRPVRICVLLRGLPGFPDGPSAVATGSRRGPFPARNLYVVTFDGKLIELFDVAIS